MKKAETTIPTTLAPLSKVFTFGHTRADGSTSWMNFYRLVGATLAIASGAAYPVMAFIWANTFQSLGTASYESVFSELRTQCFNFLALGAVTFVTLTAQTAFFELAADEATRALKIQWFQALLRQDMAYYDIKDVSGQATIVSANANKFRRGIGRKLGEGIQFTCTVLGGFIYAFYVSWKISLVILATVPLMVAAGFFMLKVTMTQTARSNKNYAEAGSVVYTTLSSIKTVLSVNATSDMLRKFTDATSKAYHAGVSFVAWVGFGNGLVFASFLVSYIALTLYGAYLLYSAVQSDGCDPSGSVQDNRTCSVTGAEVFGAMLGISFAGMTIPQISASLEAFTAARAACYPALLAIERTATNETGESAEMNKNEFDVESGTDVAIDGVEITMQGVGSKHEIVGTSDAIHIDETRRQDIPLPKYVIDSSSQYGFKPASVQGGIVFDSVWFAYPTRKSKPVLQNLSLNIKAGTTVALVGASGSGKSTVIQLIERFYDPSAGAIMLDGHDLKSLNVQWLRNSIGLVSQEPTLFARSIKENISYGRPDVSDEEIIAAAKMANAHDFITSFPNGYNTQVGDKGALLSGGQKQRIAIARALVKKPKILLLDEATSALDSENEHIVQQALDVVLDASNTTTIVVAHRLSTIRNADMIAVFKDGMIVETGTHSELLQQNGSEYGKLVEAQSRKRLVASQSCNENTLIAVTSEFMSSTALFRESVTQITFRDVHFSYPCRKDQIVLDGLNLSIRQGETLGLVGHSGGGKSTIIQLLERFYDIDSGSIEFNGVDIREWNVQYLRSQIGLVSQEPTLFNASIRENIKYGCPNATHDEVEDAAKKANAHEFIMSFPSKYDTEVGETGLQVSGGQKQRIAIARALLKKPKILLLDEATSALDSESEVHVQRAIDTLIAARMQTVIVVAHRLSTVRNADRIAVMSKGRVKEIGSHDELIAQNGDYKRLYDYQSLEGDERIADFELGRNIRGNEKEVKELEFIKENVEQISEEIHKRNASRARLMAKDDAWLLILGGIGAVLSGLVFPAWGIIFAFMIDLLYRPVYRCETLICQDYWNWEAREIEILSYKITWGWLGTMGLTILGQTLLYYGLGKATEKMNKRVRDAVFTSVIRQDMTFFDQQKVSNLATQIQEDAAMIQSFSGEPIRSLTMSLSSVLVGLIIAFVLMWPFALLTLAILPFMGFGAIMEMKMYMGEDESGEVKEMENSPGAIVVETLLNIRTVASLTIETIRAHEYSDKLCRDEPIMVKSNILKGMASGSGMLCQMWGLSLMFWWGGKVLFDHPNLFSYRDYLISMFSLLFSLSGLSVASMGITNKDKAKVAAQRIFDLIDRKSKIDSLSIEGEKPQ